MILFNALDHYIHGITCVAVRAAAARCSTEQSWSVMVVAGSFTTKQPSAVVDIDL